MSVLEKAMLNDPFGKGIISEFYQLLMSFSVESSASKLEAWKLDLQEDLTEEQWSEVCSEAQSQTGNTRLKLLQYNWLMRVYITPVKLNKFNNDIPDLCTRCGEDRGTLFHCLWSCPKLQRFWREVGQEIQNILSINVTPEPKFFILGLYPVGHKFRRSERMFIDICLLQAKRVVALSWKSPDKPSIAMWFRELCLCLPLEKITYTLKDKLEVFQEVWGHFIRYIKGNSLMHLMERPGEG